MHTRPTAVLVLGALVVLAGCAAVPPAAPSDAPASPTATATDVETPNGTLSVHFVNVGQSVSTLVVGPTGETMLIDTGGYQEDGEHVLDYLDRLGIDRIDYLVTSHADADHVGGHAAVIEQFETAGDGVGAVYDPGIAASTLTYEEYLDAVEAHDVPLYETRANDTIPMEGASVEVLGPPDPYLADRDRNENSLVVRVTFGNTSFLFTGDAAAEEEAYLVDTYGDGLRSTVLKAGHHGSKTSTGDALLDAAAPRAVVVSSDYDSRYGHPHEEVLGRLAARDLPTFWTATHGNVVLVSDGRSVAVETQRAAPTDPLSLRDGDPVEPGTTSPVERRTVLGGGTLPTRTPVATDGGTTTGGELVVASVHADAAGHDDENLNDEYVTFENVGDATLDLGGWTVADEAGHEYTFPDGVTLAPGERLTLHTGSGEDTATDLHWGAGSAVWNNGGDTVTVRTGDGTVVVREEY